MPNESVLNLETLKGILEKMEDQFDKYEKKILEASGLLRKADGYYISETCFNSYVISLKFEEQLSCDCCRADTFWEEISLSYLFMSEEELDKAIELRKNKT